MEKFNQASAPAKVESETVADIAESTKTVETPTSAEVTEQLATSSGAFMNDVPSSPESALESPSEKITRLREQKSAATDRLNSEFWPDELDQASIFQTRELLRKSARLSGVETNDDDVDIPPRVREAMEMNRQVNSIDTKIDDLYDQDPDLVENGIKEILSTHFTPDRLAVAQSEGLLWRDHDVHRNTIPLYNKELQSLLSKFEKHQGYDRSKDIDTPETRSPKYDFVENYVAQLIQERADEVAAYEAMPPEEKERYPDKQTVREKLSYQDADFPPEQLEAMLRDAEGREMAEKYAHHLNKLPKEEIDRVLPSIKGQTKKVLNILGVPTSKYGQSDSWTYWDLGKQQYYYEQNRDTEPQEGNPYTYAPALEKVDEISDRHIGWEFYHAPAETREKAFESIEDPYYLTRVFDVLQNDPKADGQLPSHEYAELGKILRGYARSKELKDSAEKDPNLSEQDVNFENNDDILLADRLSNPEINEQLVKLKHQLLKKEYDFYQNEGWEPYLPEGWTGEERFKLLKGKNSGKIIDTEDLNKKLSEPEPTLESVTKDITESIDEIRTVTHIDFETEEPDSERMGLGWEMPWTGEKPNTKQMSIINAHEKGHRVRSFYDSYTEMLRSAFDVSRVNFTEQDLEFLQKSREQSNKLVEGEKMSFEEERGNYLENYLFTGKEIAERMSQLKNYFGFAGNEQFTKKHLDYARKNYIKDTNMDNSMRLFFEAITPETEDDFLRLINNTGI